MGMTVTEQNIADFRAEWVALNGKSDALKGLSFRVAGPVAELNTALEAVLRSHGAVPAEAAPQLRIFLCTAAHEAKDPEAKVLAVFPGALPEEEHEGRMLLYTPTVYGAGLRPGGAWFAALPEDDTIPAVHAADFLHMILSAARRFSPGIFVKKEPEKPLVSREEGIRALELLEKHPDRLYYDDTAYDGQLEGLQRKGLELLLELDRICRENGISYFLGGGTLLGAVRHRGFIPWDDDVDVMMTRESFDRFAQVAPKAVGERFFFQDRGTDGSYHSPFAKLRAGGTLFVTEFSAGFPYKDQGIFLDIFAHDAAPKAKWLLKPHVFMTAFARSMVFHRWAGTPMHFYGKLKLLCRIATFFKDRCSIERLEAFERRVMTFWNGRNTGYLYDGMGEHLKHGRFPETLLEEAGEGLFEGHTFPIPKNYDQYLRFSYGDDYMTWPRPGLRRVHHTAVRFSLGGKQD